MLPWSRRGRSESLRFAAFVLVEESDKLPSMRLLLRGDFQNEILRHQINRITHFDKFLVLIDRFVLGTNDTADHGDYVGAILGRLQKGWLRSRSSEPGTRPSSTLIRWPTFRA